GRFKTENKELNLKLRQINSEYRKIDSENKILARELKKLKDSQDRTDYLNSQNRVLTDELGQARSERDSLTREAAILRDTVAELKNKFYQFEKDIVSQEQLLIQSKAQTGLRAEEVLQLQESLSALTKEKSGLQDVLKEKEGELFKKSGHIKDLDQEILTLQSELAKQSQRAQILHSENEQLKTELKNFQTSYKNLSAVLEDLSNTNTQLQNKISALSRVFEDKEVADLKNEKSVVDLGSMKVIDSEPEIALSSLIYQLRKSMDNATEQEKQEYLKKEAVLHYNLGVYYLRNDRFKDALDEFFKSYQLTPDDPDTLYNIGLIYRYYIYDYDKAKDYLQRYLKLRPKSEDRKKAEAIIKEMSK
ncbi:MAG: hypothetical protein PHQ54_05015, partial [Candidatus Omnitrophica bacterium]|nr:hypothetical protein [Candidatus Omnitrophota bacterium]